MPPRFGMAPQWMVGLYACSYLTYSDYHLEPLFLLYVWYMYSIYHTYVDVIHMYGICMVYVWYILGYTIHMYSNGYTMYIQVYT